MGHIATHAIVVARLVTKGVDHGPHTFIVQIRSLEDHTPMPGTACSILEHITQQSSLGIEVGDIGPKFGYFGMDNGFLKLDDVHIPRNQMLMKFSKV